MGLLRILQNRNKILGLNERYLSYIRPYNLKQSFAIADNKILTKKRLQRADIPVPKMLGKISNYKELYKFKFLNLPKSFVLKPVRGLEGGGIEILYNRVNDEWIKSDGSRLSVDDLISRCRDILDGKYSLLNQPDEVLIEERIKPHKAFREYTYKGTPDIRVIVFNSIPVMSMLRLPTKQSDGKANLRLGAIGCGIDMAVGRVTQAIIGKAGTIEYIPGTNLRLSGLKIPQWNSILEHAVKASRTTGLGFGSIDFLIDREQGPMVIEINARTGLSIQLAEQDGLLWRLEKARGLKVKTVKQGVRLGKELYGGEIAEEIENISGKTLVGLIAKAKLINPLNNKSLEILSKIDTGADSSSVDISVVEQLGYEEILGKYKEYLDVSADTRDELVDELNKIDQKTGLFKVDRTTPGTGVLSIDGLQRIIVKSASGITARIKLPIQIVLEDEVINTHVNITDRSHLKYSTLIGSKDLKGFIIDCNKRIVMS